MVASQQTIDEAGEAHNADPSTESSSRLMGNDGFRQGKPSRKHILSEERVAAGRRRDQAEDTERRDVRLHRIAS